MAEGVRTEIGKLLFQQKILQLTLFCWKHSLVKGMAKQNIRIGPASTVRVSPLL